MEYSHGEIEIPRLRIITEESDELVIEHEETVNFKDTQLSCIWHVLIPPFGNKGLPLELHTRSGDILCHFGWQIAILADILICVFISFFVAPDAVILWLSVGQIGLIVLILIRSIIVLAQL